MKSRSFAAFIAMLALVVLTIPASAAQDASTQADGTSITTPANPVPLINQPLVPDAVKPGGGGFTLTVNGTGFVRSAVVKWNGSPRITTFVSESRLTASVLSTDILKPGTAAVKVVNPTPGGGQSNVVFLEISYAGPLLFGGGSNFGNGNTTDFVATADFNHDGKEDLAVADINNNDLMVMLGKGDGTFQTAVHYALGAGPGSIAVGDFNGDGNLDLAVSDGNISILLGKGDGTFLPAVAINVGGGIGPIAVGDFNRDGKLDLAAADGNAVSILLGNGDGTFKSPVSYPLATGAQAVAIGDFNRDGKLDLALALGNFDGTGAEAAILLGNGDGSFEPAVNYPTGGGPFGITVGDFNHDGLLDIATANAYADTVSVLLGNGDGTFKSHVDYGVGSSFPVSITSADFNATGKLDLIVANLYGDDVSVLLGNGDGTFQTAQTIPLGTLTNTDSPGSVTVADFNGDGRLDVVVPTYASGQAGILLQVPTVTLSRSGLQFANQVLGTNSVSQVVTLTNTSVLPLQIGSIVVTGTNATDFSQTHTCGSTLSHGASCTITTVFKPTQPGPRTGFVTITDDATPSPQQVAMNGTGVVSGPNATVSPTTLTFATQVVGSTSPPEVVNLSNYGTAADPITSITTSGDFQEGNNCGTSLAAGASCTINVTFKPTQIDVRSGKLSIHDGAPGTPQTVSLAGEGTVVQLVPPSLSFFCQHRRNTVCQPVPPKTATLTNTGSKILDISGITISGANAFSQKNNCPSNLAVRASCTITVTFKPPLSGTVSGSVSISDNGGASPQQLPLSGKVIKQGASAKARAALAKPGTLVVPSPTGKSQIGTRVMHLLDSTRQDPFLANATKRELLIRFWYPVSPDENCRPAEYTSPRVWSYFSKLLGSPLPAITTNSCQNAPVLDASHPVVVFTHGYTGTFTDYTFLFEELASRGYIVASIDHTYEATAAEFPDQRFVKSLVGTHLANTWQTDDQTLSSALSVRLDDLKFVIDELERLNASTGNAFAGKLDLTRLALAGHSLGGLSSWFGVQRDARFKAAVLLDPYLLDIPLGSTETPVMLLTMGHQQQNDDECELWSNLLGSRFSVNLRGAEHVTPSDLVWLAKGVVETGPMGPEKTIAAVRDYIAAFLDVTLRGGPASRLLTEPSPEYPDVAVTTQEQALCRQP